MDAKGVATTLNSFRVIPRLLIILYGYMAWDVSVWFMELPTPSGPQAALVSTIWGAGAVWFTAYTNTGKS